MSLAVVIYEDFSEIDEVWDKLLSQSVNNKIFLHTIYHQTWWETMGEGELQIVTVRNDESKLVGLAPFFIHENSLRFVGCKDVTDYLDVLVDHQYQTEVYEQIGQYIVELIKQGKVREVELCSIPQTSPTLEILPNVIKQLLPTANLTIDQQDVCPQITLPDTFDQYLTSLDRKQRHEIRRKWRKLENEAEIRFRCVTSLNTSEQNLDAVQTFIHLHQLSSPDKHDFWNDHHRAFFELLLPRMAEQGWLKLFFLEIVAWKENSFDLPLPNQPIAAMLVFDYDNVYNLYNSGYDPHYRSLSSGQVLTAYTIQQAIIEKRAMYDFLRGDEEYKFRLGGVPLPVMDLKISLDSTKNPA